MFQAGAQPERQRSGGLGLKPAPTARAQRRAAWQAQFRRPAAGRTIQVQIAELALKGFEKGSERRIAAAFQRELHAQLTRELPPGWGTASSTGALTARLRMRSGRDPVAIGEQLAAAVLSAYREERG